MTHLVEQVTDIKTELGEGLAWDVRSQRLLMTDIMQGRLIEIDPASGSRNCWQFKEPLAWVLPTALHGHYALGLKSGVALWDRCKSDDLAWIQKSFPGHSDFRLNDAGVDARGRLWYGSMNMRHPSSRDGRLASLAPGEGLRMHDEGFTVTNGPVISLDGKFLYFNDTLQGTVYRYRMSGENGDLSDRQVFAQFDADQGYPDGMCFDREGHLWIALWGGACVVQMDANGRLLRRLAVPAKNVTNLCFCGPNLDRLWVSSATIGMSEEEALAYPASGGLFEIHEHGSAGVAPHLVNLDPLWI